MAKQPEEWTTVNEWSLEVVGDWVRKVATTDDNSCQHIDF